MSDAKPAAEGEAKASGGLVKKLMLPLFAVFNFAVIGAGGYLTYASTLGYKPKTLAEDAAVEELAKSRAEGPVVNEKVLYTMPVFTVNLAGQPRRLIRVEMTFEMLDKEGFEEIVRNSPLARDEIMRILNRTTFDDIETIQGKLSLKDKIAVTLNESFKAGVVKDIYFNDFIVQ